jgi:chemotaxis protein MotB
MRVRRPSPRAGQDRWLISYADLVTLLFACFTTVYAASVTSTKDETPPPAPSTVDAVEIPEVPAPAPVQEDSAPSLRDRLAPALSAGLEDVEIEVIEDARGLVISLPETATFPTGSADLSLPAQALLHRIAEALRETRATIRIEGHTDDAAIRGGRHGSNWELSTARASAVVVFMVTRAAFEPSRLSAAGYGEFHPRATNDTPEGRALNRRVDVVVIDAPSQATSMTPAVPGP